LPQEARFKINVHRRIDLKCYLMAIRINKS